MKIGIVGAMEDELGAVKALIEEPTITQHGRWPITQGRVGTHEIVLTRCDIGKVNGAIATQMLIERYGVEAIFNLGSSGAMAPELEIGDLVIGQDAAQPDVNLTPWGVPLGGVMFDAYLAEGDDRLTFRHEVTFSMNEMLVSAAKTAAAETKFAHVGDSLPTVHHGRLLSSDTFMSDHEQVSLLREEFGALCIDMEAAAIAQTCASNDIPCLIIRTISDKADGSAADSFHSFLVAATANYGLLLEQLLDNLR